MVSGSVVPKNKSCFFRASNLTCSPARRKPSLPNSHVSEVAEHEFTGHSNTVFSWHRFFFVGWSLSIRRLWHFCPSFTTAASFWGYNTGCRVGVFLQWSRGQISKFTSVSTFGHTALEMKVNHWCSGKRFIQKTIKLFRCPRRRFSCLALTHGVLES